jgi:hypothetical protein
MAHTQDGWIEMEDRGEEEEEEEEKSRLGKRG